MPDIGHFFFAFFLEPLLVKHFDLALKLNY
jgi:hypothetical protein